MKRLLTLLLVLCLLLPTTAFAQTEWEWKATDDGLYILVPSGSGGNGNAGVTVTITGNDDAGYKSSGAAGNYLNVKDVSGNYKKGSIYGPKLSTKQLKEVKKAVITAVNSCILEGMSDAEKIVAMVNYLCDICSYADDWSKNKANTAWGALVYGEAQCSGYARAMVALMDAVGIECKYVHASKQAVNPSHQWVVVKVGGQWYHLDPQYVDSYTRISNGVVTYPRPIVLHGGTYMPYETKGIPQTASTSITLQ